MSSTYQPMGLRPIGRVGNSPYDGGFTHFPLTTNNTAAMAVGDPVALIAGSVVPLTANPVSGTLSANTQLGVFLGCDYKDALGNRTFVNSQKIAAGAVTGFQFSAIDIMVDNDENLRFEIQCNGSVTAAQVGCAINMGGFGAADMVYGTSRVYADVATIDNSAGSTKALKIVGISKAEDNAAGDAYTKLVVRWNAGVHQSSFAGAH